jgi:hypothetical protein
VVRLRGIDGVKGRTNLEIVEMKPNLKNLNDIHREKSGKSTGNTSTVVSPPDNDQTNERPNCMNRFWTFIKHRRSDGRQIPPLKSDGTLHS